MYPTRFFHNLTRYITHLGYLFIPTLPLVALLFGCQGMEKPNPHLLGQENAVWTESIYLRGYKPSTGKKLTEDDLKKYAETLKKNNIKYAFLFAGPYQKDGHLPEYPFSELAKNSIKKLKAYYPEIRILPWTGGVQDKTVFLNDSLWIENALEDTKKLVKLLEVPGVHVDFEFIQGNSYIRNKNHALIKKGVAYAKNVNSFHKRLRSLLPDSFISSVVVSTAPDTRPWKRKTTINELSSLVPYIDQLCFLFYDTYIHDQKIFEKNAKQQIEDIETLRQFNKKAQFLMAIGTFINEPHLQVYRNLNIESIPNTLEVIKNSIVKVNDSIKLVDGIVIYCDWETDEQEWNEFYNNWGKIE